MDFVLGIIFGVASMLGFGVVDFLLVRPSKSIGAFRTALWPTVFQVITTFILALFLFHYVPITPYLLAIIMGAGLGSAAGSIFMMKGLQFGSASIIAPVTSGWAAISAILGFVFLNEIVTDLQVLFICLVIFGTILVSLNTGDLLRLGSRKLHSGVEYGLVSMLGWGVYFFLISILTEALGVFSAIFLVYFARLFFILLYGIIIKADFSLPKEESKNLFFVSVLIVASFLAYNLGVIYNYVDIVAPITAAAAVVTVLLAIMLLHERITKIQIGGVAIAVLGLVLLSLG
ncbi:MAG: DMT family transporter [Candidatus Micrarchaeota archaeon]|nr:DMT family transporter [Candidatus Micrarchaeota archaeon]